VVLRKAPFSGEDCRVRRCRAVLFGRFWHERVVSVATTTTKIILELPQTPRITPNFLQSRVRV